VPHTWTIFNQFNDNDPKSRDSGSHGFTAVALFMLTLFQRSPVRDVATVVQYDTIAARSSHGARPTTVPRHRALCSSVLKRRLVYDDYDYENNNNVVILQQQTLT